MTGGEVRQFGEEAVRFSRIGRSPLYTLMGAGELAYTKVGVRRLIPRKALVELFARYATRTAGS